MLPIEFDGSRWIGKPKEMTDEQCSGIWAAEATTKDGYHFWVTAWQPSREDLEAMNRGEAVYMQIVSEGLPPASLFTVNEEGEIN